jgi:hypothetical protein
MDMAIIPIGAPFLGAGEFTGLLSVTVINLIFSKMNEYKINNILQLSEIRFL